MGPWYKCSFFAYNASAYRIVNNNHETNHAFMGTNVGLNLYDWQLRHTGQWKWQDHNEIQEKVSSYTSNNTYAQKAFPKLNSVVTLGDYFTNNNFLMPCLIVGLTYQVMTACFLTVCSDMLPKFEVMLKPMQK